MMSEQNRAPESEQGERARQAVGGRARRQVAGDDLDQVLDMKLQQGELLVEGLDSRGQPLAKIQTAGAALQRIAEAARETSEQLEKDYEQARRQASSWSLVSIIAAALGFVVMAAGVVLAFTGSMQTGIVTAVSGIIPEVAAALFFRQAREANQRVDSYHKDLLAAQNLDRAVELLNTLEDGEEKDRLTEAIIRKILGID